MNRKIRMQHQMITTARIITPTIMITLLSIILIMPVLAMEGAQLSASVLRYEPLPVEPGNTFEVWVQMTNKGTRADNVDIRFVQEYPFSLPPGQDDSEMTDVYIDKAYGARAAPEISLGAIGALEDKVVKFNLYADPTTPNGNKTLKFQYRYKYGNSWGRGWVLLEAPIKVRTQSAALVVDAYTVAPQPVTPGGTATLTLEINNAGRTTVKNVDISLNTNGAKFSTVGTSTKKRINFLGPGEKQEVGFTLASDTSTEVNVYKIPLQLSYQDESNNKYNSTSDISIVVDSKPEIAVVVEKINFAKKNGSGVVTLKIINKGVPNLKYVNVKLAQGEYILEGPSNEVYVGNLDSDDYETVDFKIKPHTNTPDLLIKVEFKNPYNTDFIQEYTLPIKIVIEEQKSNIGMIIGIIGVVIVIGMIYWRNKNRKKGK